MADAIARVKVSDPYAVITDSNYGVAGLSGADLLQYIEKNISRLARLF